MSLSEPYIIEYWRQEISRLQPAGKDTANIVRILPKNAKYRTGYDFPVTEIGKMPHAASNLMRAMQHASAFGYNMAKHEIREALGIANSGVYK